MIYVFTLVSLIIVSSSLIFLGKWVKRDMQIYALIGLTIIEISLIMILATL